MLVKDSCNVCGLSSAKPAKGRLTSCLKQDEALLRAKEPNIHHGKNSK
jgi:hypothetical protein